ncbi:ABC transporter permease [Bosea sp. AS-1]|uniref:ABC transporter permease n=1 Tax=Bosea sp. AS-1 TaxID=2015316 RepID=UPI000B76BE9D|nr:ABC transporter permease [Bosea sp. AS-1]
MTLAGFDRRDYGMLLSLFRMALSDRFLGSALGLVWAVLSPLMLMGIFVFVFTFVFPSRLPGREGALPFVIWLISGYGPWLGINEGLSSATSSVTSNAGIVKNIAFKSELLPVVGAMLGLVPLGVGLSLVVILKFVSGEGLSWTVVALPAVIVLQLLFVSGVGLFLSALNVFVRDTALALPSVLTIVLFASPIFYPLSAYPAAIRAILIFNPFYVLAECYRAPLLANSLPPVWMLAYLAVFSSALIAGGLWWFRRLKSFFDTRL